MPIGKYHNSFDQQLYVSHYFQTTLTRAHMCAHKHTLPPPNIEREETTNVYIFTIILIYITSAFDKRRRQRMGTGAKEIGKVFDLIIPLPPPGGPPEGSPARGPRGQHSYPRRGLPGAYPPPRAYAYPRGGYLGEPFSRPPERPGLGFQLSISLYSRLWLMYARPSPPPSPHTHSAARNLFLPSRSERGNNWFLESIILSQ